MLGPTPEAYTGIDIHLTGPFLAQNGASLQSSQFGTPFNGGDIQIVAETVTLTGSVIDTRGFNGARLLAHIIPVKLVLDVQVFSTAPYD